MTAIDDVQGLGSIEHAYYRREKPLAGVVLLPGQETHATGEHPENPRRLPGVVEHLRGLPQWDDLFVLYPRYARTEDLVRAHDERFVELLRSATADAPVWLDTDTLASEGSFALASLASGAALAAVDALAMEAYWKPDVLFALTRPPGHHATPDRAMGFCLVNHVSVAARYAREVYGLERIAVVDWDVHHGNGTQEIHWRDPSLLFVSLHQWPLYPGTGWHDERGEGPGEGFTVNLPMPPGSGDREYHEAFDAVVEPILDAYDPQLLIVSAGQDGHAADTLSNQMLSAAGFRRMAERMAAFSRERGIGTLVVHEGGYNVTTLPQLDAAILGGLAGFETDLDDPFADGAPPVVGWSERLREIRASAGISWPQVAP